MSLYGQCIVQQVKWNANKLNTKISPFTTSDLIKPIAFLLESSFSGKIYCYSSGQKFIYIFLFPIHCRMKNVIVTLNIFRRKVYKNFGCFFQFLNKPSGKKLLMALTCLYTIQILLRGNKTLTSFFSQGSSRINASQNISKILVGPKRALESIQNWPLV